MFHAFIVVCAASFNQVYTDTCFRLDDSWGPHRTEENCYIRSQQIVDDVLTGDLNSLVTNMFFLRFRAIPQGIYAEGFCEANGQIES
jgi:hypothetical protein